MSTTATGIRGLCLVCAQEGTLLNTLPQKVPRIRIG